MDNDKKMNNSKSDKFNEAYETILKMNGDLDGEDPRIVLSHLIHSSDPEGKKKELEKLKKIYTHITIPNGKMNLAQRILHGMYPIEKILIVILDNLFYQHKEGGNPIHNILKKYSILDESFNLTSNEYDLIISALLDLLEAPYPDVQNYDDLRINHIVLMKREHAGGLLKQLLKQGKLSQKNKEMIKRKGNLIVTPYSDIDYGVDFDMPSHLKSYFISID